MTPVLLALHCIDPRNEISHACAESDTLGYTATEDSKCVRLDYGGTEYSAAPVKHLSPHNGSTAEVPGVSERATHVLHVLDDLNITPNSSPGKTKAQYRKSESPQACTRPSSSSLRWDCSD